MDLTNGYYHLIMTIILIINNLGVVSSQNQNIQHKGGGTSFTNIQIYQNNQKNGLGYGNSGNSIVNQKKTLVNIVNKIKHPQEYNTGPKDQNFLPNGKPQNQNYQSSSPGNNQNFNSGRSSNFNQKQKQQYQHQQQQQQQIQPSQITYIYNIPQNQQYQQEDRSNPYDTNRENYQDQQNYNQNYQHQHQTDQQVKLYSASAGTHRPANFQQQQQQYELQSNLYSENQGPLISRQQREQSPYNNNGISNEYQQQGQAFVNQFEVPTTNFESNNQQQQGEFEVKFQTGPIGDISHLNYDDQPQQIPNSPHFGPPTSQELQSQPISFKSNIIPEFTTNVQGPSSFPPPTSSSGHAYTPNGHLLVPVTPPPLNLLKQGQVLQENVYGAPNQNQGYSSNSQNQGYSNSGQNQGYVSGPSGQQQQYGNPSDSGGYPDQNQKSQGYSSGPTSQSFSGYLGQGQGQGQSEQYGQPDPSQGSPTNDGYSSGGISGSYGPGPGLDSRGGYGGENGPENGPPSSEYGGPSQIPYTATASLDIEYGPDSDPGPGYGIPPEYGKPPSHDQIIKIEPEEQTFFLEQHHDHYDHHHHHHHHSEPLLERVDLLPHTTYIEEFDYPHHTHTHSHTHSEVSHISYLTSPEHHLPPPPPYQFKIVPKIQIEIKPQDKGWQPIFKPSAVDYGPPKSQAQGGYDIKNNNNGTAQYGPPPNVTSTVGSKTIQGQKTQVQGGGQRVQGQQGGEISSGPGQVGTTEGPFISADGVTRFTTQRTQNVIQQQEREKVNRQQQSRGPDQQSRGPIVTNQVQGGQGPVQQGQVTGGYDYTPAQNQPKKQVQAVTTPPVNTGDQSSASESQSKFTDKNNSSSKVKALGSLVLDSYEVTDVSDGKFSFTGNKKGQDGSNSIIELPNQPVGQSKDGGQTVYLVSRLLIVDKNKTHQPQDVRVGESSQNQQRKVIQNQNQRNLSNNLNGNKIFYQQNRPNNNNNRQQRPQQHQQQQQQQNRRPQASNQQQQFVNQQNNRQSVGAKFANRPNNNGIRPNQQQQNPNPNINTQIIQQLKLLNNKIEKIEERINTKQVNKRQTIKFQAQFKTAGQMVKKSQQFQNQSYNHNQRNQVNFRNQSQSKNA